MSTVLTSEKNGSKVHKPDEQWKRQSIRQFFSNVNWDDHPPEIQKMRATLAAQPESHLSKEPLSLKLSVQQFFNAVNWEDAAIADVPAPYSPPNGKSAQSDGSFTLDDFSDLF